MLRFLFDLEDSVNSLMDDDNESHEENGQEFGT